MKTVTTAEMRALDRAATEEFGIASEELMRRAGNEVGLYIDHLIDRCGFKNPVIQLVAGRGNNGGDAFAAARHLHEEGQDVEVLLAGSVSELRGDALRHLGQMRAAGVRLHELPTMDDWENFIVAGERGEIIVDGVLGIGIKGPPRGPVAGAIRFINTLAAEALIVAIDVPSGLDADTGTSPGDTVRADVTLTIGLPKPGMLVPAALDFVGAVEIIDIGIPLEMVRNLHTDPEMIAACDLLRLFPPRPRRAHKGDYGHLLLIAGASGYAGAAILCGRAAVRSGVGLVSMITPATIGSAVMTAVPETMVHVSVATSEGGIAPEALQAWAGTWNAFTAVAAGPGMNRHNGTAVIVRELLRECSVPLILDADALNVLAGEIVLVKSAKAPVILTPHPGELARLLAITVPEVLADPHNAARRAADQSGATVILKGAGTVVAQAGKPLAVNLTGNPGMATGGAGDVLTGLLGGLLAQGLSPFDAACAAVFLHGKAGDAAAWRKTQTGLSALDLIEELPYTFREVTTR